MIKYIQNRFAMSEKGARDFLKASFATTLQNLTFMLPIMLVYIFLEKDLLPLMSGTINQSSHIGLYIAIIVISCIIIYIASYWQYNSSYLTTYTECANRRISIAEKLRKLPLSFFGEKNLSDLSSTILSDVADLEQLFSHCVPQLVGASLTLIIAFFGLGYFNWTLTIALFWVVPIVLIIFIGTKKIEKNIHQKEYVRKRKLSEKIQEGIDQIQEIKSYNHEERYLNELKTELDDYEKNQTKGELQIGIIINLIQAIIKMGLPTLILVGATLLIKGNIDFLTYLFFLIISSVIYEPLLQVLNQGAILFYIDVRIDRMNEILNLPTQKGVTHCEPNNFDIRFEHVDFSYQDGKSVLKDVSFLAKQGEVTALIGPSGGGKSTSAKLSARFWDINKGSITLGGINVNSIDPETLLHYYAIVFQDVVLFNASVMDNIRIGRKEASDEEVLRMASLAQCDEFVNKLPEGYDTIIGENGNTLSGGERQRISIARALLKDAPIVLLDEATASLDVENETQIQKALSHLIKNRTVLIIAHRMRTIANADKIVVLQEGRVVESGSPKELMNKESIYRQMINTQSCIEV
ncbi:ABC transporter ATP-binding protein [Porphyromonas pogonae]|uniref:ABC transporter ATP-binding protein n=1 Tax=Porphyromonas pogonae TaxID=867595 RepID=UPI002E7895E1|nr:ABC transporter ATP-binding protein [Porphyromonas pogonae]